MNSKLSLRSFFYLLFALLIFSCSEPCDDVNCGDNGTCLEGLCICDDGYEGINCETELRAKFVGLWKSTDYNCGGLNNLDVDWEVTRGTGINDFNVTLFAGTTSETQLNATYSGNIITMPLADFGTTYQGTLELVGNTLVLKFQIDNGIALIDCTATGTL